MKKASPTKEKSLLFTVAMARARRQKWKSQTRRTMNPQPPKWAKICQNLKHLDVNHQWVPSNMFQWCEPEKNPPRRLRRWPSDEGGHCALTSPYGWPGDRVVLLTTWATEKKYDGLKPSDLPKKARIWSYFDGDDKPKWAGRLRMGRFLPTRLRGSMPRDVIKEVRAERCQEISETDAIAEGIRMVTKDGVVFKYCIYDTRDSSRWAWQDMPTTARDAYARLRDEINGPGTWAKNEWVWVIVFEDGK